MCVSVSMAVRSYRDLDIHMCGSNLLKWSKREVLRIICGFKSIIIVGFIWRRFGRLGRNVTPKPPICEIAKKNVASISRSFLFLGVVPRHVPPLCFTVPFCRSTDEVVTDASRKDHVVSILFQITGIDRTNIDHLITGLLDARYFRGAPG